MENAQSMLQRDMISNLDETILLYLPTRDAVRTSILSRKWRHVWTKLPHFVLDKTLWDIVAVEYSAKTTLMEILYQLLLSHDGPIHKFTLSNPDLKSCPEIDNLIFFLGKSHLEDFTLEMWKDRYLLPSSFFLCHELRHLSLRLCSIKSLKSITFRRLKSLKLIDVNISAKTLESLILGSPLLALLEIVSYSEVDICIDAPNLITLIVSSVKIKSINFKRVPALAITSSASFGFINFVDVGQDIDKFFYHFLALKTLQLSFHVVLSLGVKIQKRLPTSLVHLKDLKLSRIGFNEKIELAFILCLLRSSPNWKYIEISIKELPNSNSEGTTTYMKREDFSDIYLSELREVKLDHVRGTKPEFEFIRLLLDKSSSLKKIQIQPEENAVDNGFNILKEVIKFRRISKEAEIIFV